MKRFLESPLAFVAAVMLAIVAFGAGLTSPIWFLLEGKPPVDAMNAGAPIIMMTLVGLVLMTVLGLIFQKLRKPATPEVDAAIGKEPEGRHKHLIIHIVLMLMFIIPFVSIVLGILFKNVIEAE